MPKQPKFIKKYLSNGDYNLILNPNYNQLRDYKQSMGRSLYNRPYSIWNKLQNKSVNVSKKRKSKRIGSYDYKGVQQRIEQANFEQKLMLFKLSLNGLNKDEKIRKLQHMAEIFKYENVGINYRSRRQFHNQHKNQWFESWKSCYTCRIKPVENIHHIVMAKNGGTNDEVNLIGICKECHAEIHPWLKEKVA